MSIETRRWDSPRILITSKDKSYPQEEVFCVILWKPNRISDLIRESKEIGLMGQEWIETFRKAFSEIGPSIPITFRKLYNRKSSRTKVTGRWLSPVERQALNLLAAGSNPARPAILFLWMNRTILLSHQPIIVRWNILTWKSSWPSRNGTGHFLLLNMNYVSWGIDISMEMLFTLYTVEELASFHFGSWDFIRYSNPSLPTLVKGLTGVSWIDSPYTILRMAKGLSHISHGIDNLSPKVCTQWPW